MAAEKAREAGSEEVVEAEDAAPEEGANEAERDDRARARETARAERRAHKETAKAAKGARRRSRREEKSERRRRRRDEKSEKRVAKKERAEKGKAERAKAERTGDRPEPKPKKAQPKKAEKPKASEKTGPGAPEREEREGRTAPKRERAAGGATIRKAGTGANAALTEARAKRAATRVDNGIQTAWKLLLAGLASLLAGALIIGRFVLGGLRELWAVWIRTAEVLGAGILWVERRARPIVLAMVRAARRAIAYAERVVTPKRAVAFVVIAVAVALAASQFVDYRGVRIGAPAYADVEAVAPAPQTDRETAGSVHGYAMVPVAVVIIGAALLALSGRWRVARVIPVLAALAIAVTLLLDARRGLDEGEAAIAYQGAQAVLIEGFWVQLTSAAVLVMAGLLLIRYARIAAEPARRRRPSGDGRERPPRKRRFRIAGVRA